ncbi:ATP-binding protein [Arcobacter sp. 15-2]|uniref:sensor histidine kinase n=1 Tax=Arcobacter sp. 15-2 TaxID=3374109 RepID=UPI00399CEB06
MKFRSLKQKILFWFVGIISTVLIVFSLLLYILLEDGIHGEIKMQMESKTSFIQENIISEFPDEKIKLYSKLLNVEFVIFNKGELLYASNKFPLENIELYQESENMFFVHKTKNNTEDAILRTKFISPYKGEIILYLKEINNQAEKIEQVLIYLNPLLFLLLIWIGNNLIDKLLIPIKTLTRTTQKINIEDMPKKIHTPNENNEITQLMNSFNDMIERLRNGIETLNNFNHDVSHELKTPITVINTAIELSLRKNHDVQYYKNSIKTIQYEIKQIEKIIDELFLFTKYSQENIQSTFKYSYLDSILIDVISKYEKQAADKNILLTIKKIENIKKSVNPLLINIIFSNLIDNAIKYTSKEKEINIELFAENNHAYFRIEDEGIGIQKEHLDKITDKFYRVDESRNKKINGFGLGLSIVKNFIDLHNANLDIQSIYNKGTTITVRF